MSGIEEALEEPLRPAAERIEAEAGDEDDAEEDSSSGRTGASSSSG